MRLRYKNDDGNYTDYTILKYDDVEGKFVLRSVDGDFLEYFPILSLDAEYDPQNYWIELLNNHSTTENSIFTVFVKSEKDWKRIGWIFPIQALLSKEHSQANNVFFLKYAYVATYLLLNNLDIIRKDEPEELYIDQLFEDVDKNLLVLDKDNCKNIPCFDLENYIVSLYQHGYTWKGDAECFEEIPYSTENKPSRIKLERISPNIQANKIINMFFKEQLPEARHSLFKFFLCYQIIELMIQEVFRCEFKKMLDEIEEDDEALFDVRDQLNEVAGEKHRIKKLFNKYTNSDGINDSKTLGEACGRFLSFMNRKVPEDIPGRLYAVRCLLVHKLYTVQTSDNQVVIDGMLKDINVELINVLIKMIYTFKGE